MRTLRPLLLLVAFSAAALAGTRAVTTNGAAPTAPTDGVGLGDVTACRAVIYFIDGGTVMGGKVVPHYRDNVTGLWAEGPSTSNCSLDTSKLLDGGSRRTQSCEWSVINSFGRAAVATSGLTGEDAGTVAQAQVLLECSGERLP